MKPAVATYQVPWEFDHLLALVADLIDGGSVLEVGSYEGGTLWHWLQIADTVVAIDDQMRGSDEWVRWADEADTELWRVEGNSGNLSAVAAAASHGPYDFIFIDADHTYEAVHADWLNYRPMLAEGGAIAFHDILPRFGYGVADVWREVKEVQGVRWIAIAQNRVEPGNEGRCGIGVAWLP